MHEGSRAISKELPPARERGGRGQAGRDTGTDTGRPHSPPHAERLRSAPRTGCCRTGSAGRGAPSPRRGRGEVMAVSPLSLLGVFWFWFFFWRRLDPLFWGRLPVAAPSPGFLRVLYLGMCLAIVVACVINCTGPFLALCGSAV